MDKQIERIGFSVDAGLIQRLGYELVGRAETAVSELIKNSYDADATNVNVNFINTDEIHGTLIIMDNGSGMSQKQLIDGFMRISSTDKIHNPISKKYNRTKAGRKGIGRFATQRLGTKLTIITQTKEEDTAIKVSIDWDRFVVDQDISDITFPLEIVKKERSEGTTLVIDNLRDKWSKASINRVYRYVMDLFQPDYLSDKSFKQNFAKRNENVFKVVFKQSNNNESIILNNEQLSIFDKSLATIEGYIDETHIAHLKVHSDSLDLNDSDIIINSEDNSAYNSLSDVYFKIYYFIYNRPQYYKGKVSNMELSKINELSKSASGVRLYRNGFRVLPYGEVTDDWTQIDRRWSSESGIVNVPLSNKNLFGFVEISDPNGDAFEETASREGLIENESFRQLTDFIHKALILARNRISEKITVFKTESNEDDYTQKNLNEEQSDQELIHSLMQSIHNDTNKQPREKNIIIKRINRLIEEAGMLRVLAGLGLTIGEFTHEIKQYQPSIYGLIHKIRNNNLPATSVPTINSLKQNIDDLFSYTRFFNATISQNTTREKQPIDILEIIDTFYNTIKNDLLTNKIELNVEEYDFEAYTLPMHKSEWSSILFNLYSNSRKAIRRAHVATGNILIEVASVNNYVCIRFNDNGDGIPIENRNRIFNAFYSTSTPASFSAPQNEQLVGTGLGLKIVKDIIISYKGSIKVTNPTDGYNTCFEILIPKNNN
ncbi:sensor histidine kinase [Barnesiella intestinihominis]|jgi:histidine kinase|uniref:sensor histidine kinase n=1 Tax=Barnesiella intestinihominis TaxID=487174 RepID=UPI003AB3DD41